MLFISVMDKSQLTRFINHMYSFPKYHDVYILQPPKLVPQAACVQLPSDTKDVTVHVFSYLLGSITATLFSDWNIKKILSYMVFLKTWSPRHKFRFSDTAWLRQDKSADHILRRLHERQGSQIRLISWNYFIILAGCRMI